MLLALLDGEPTGQRGGYKHAGPLMIVQKILCGKSFCKELFAIAATGHIWEQKKVLFHYDNLSVCAIWRKGSTKSPETMALVRMLYFVLLNLTFMS